MKKESQKYWFKRKRYGWGGVPSRWQGWVFLVAWSAVWIFVLVQFLTRVNENQTISSSGLGGFIALIVLMIAILLLICHKKGEKPKWSWGK